MLIADAPSLNDLAHDDGACRDWIRGAVLGHWHASCTCRMGSESDGGAVTDPSARVYGIEGVRVADASIMPIGALRQHQHPDHHDRRKGRGDHPGGTLSPALAFDPGDAQNAAP